ncbi:ion transporter [Lewinella cohaerens]|uniref:ion transporter n=1 Tax=Lewinella cohaerens TaxID=70995 RepID=UPI00037A0FF9|nr:ion transporter [Lewinella cohaerens]
MSKPQSKPKRKPEHPPHINPTREKLHEIIFEADTPVGKVFDIALLILIVLSILMVMLESIDNFQANHKKILIIIEWVLTVIFTIEYVLRLWAVYNPWKYARSFFGVIDLLAILPTYIAFFFGGAQAFLVIRALRLMRIFRILKLGHFLSEGQYIASALRASFTKITVFLFFISILVTILGAIMYLIEGGTNQGFSNIPSSIYWAIVTLTTVGYGDITPLTAVGKMLSAIVMVLGYAIIAVPTGIVTGELIKQARDNRNNTQACRYCGQEGHDDDAEYCKYCGNILNLPKIENDDEESSMF